MEELARVLLEVDPHEADRARPRRRVDLDPPAGRERAVVLGDLVSLREVRIEVVLAREARVAVDRRAHGRREAQRERDGVAVQDRQRPGETEADRAGRFVGGRADGDRTGAEDLRARLELGVDFQPDDGENPRLFRRFDGRHRGILARRTSGRGSARLSPYNAAMSGWTEEIVGGVPIFRPAEEPPGVLVAFSGRGVAPAGEDVADRVPRGAARAGALARRSADRARDAGPRLPRRPRARGARRGEPSSTRANATSSRPTAPASPSPSRRPTACRSCSPRRARSRRLTPDGAARPPAPASAAVAALGGARRGAELAARLARARDRGLLLRGRRRGGGAVRRRVPARLLRRALSPRSAGRQPRAARGRPACRPRRSPSTPDAPFAAESKYASYRRDGAAAGRMIGMVMRLG